MSITEIGPAPSHDPSGGAQAPSARVRRGPLPTAALVLAAGLLGAGTVHVLAPAATPDATRTTSDVAADGGFRGNSPLGSSGTLPNLRGNRGSGSAGNTPTNAAAVASKINPAIVDITTTLGLLNGEAAGTGIVLTPDGEILTNNHVISGATDIKVTDIGNGRTYTADVVGYDKAADVAVLQLRNAGGLATAAIATTAAKVGDGVVGVGNAGGVGGTPSYAAGVVTATGQTITASDEADGSAEQLTDLIQTDAAIVSGDSGGPMVNTAGEVVGLDTAASTGYRFSRTSEGFAIPIATALRIAQEIEAGHASDEIHLGPTAMLGIAVQPDQAGYPSGGALVAQVLAGGPAAKAGLTGGDTITAIGGRTVRSASDLTNAMLTLKPGADVSVVYRDANGSARTAQVRLVEGPAQ